MKSLINIVGKDMMKIIYDYKDEMEILLYKEKENEVIEEIYFKSQVYYIASKQDFREIIKFYNKTFNLSIHHKQYKRITGSLLFLKNVYTSILNELEICYGYNEEYDIYID